LAAAREGYPRMSAAFRRRLSGRLGLAGSEGVTRRGALVAGVAGLAALAGGLSGLGAARLMEPRAPAPAGPGATIHPDQGRWMDVAALIDLPEGQGVKVTAGAVSAYLFRSGTRVTAVSAICSHLPCALDWQASRGVLLCPCHQQAFTPQGRSTSAAYPMPDLSRVMVRVESGRVLVMGAERTRA
ncbi:MAG: ubiquinol-cytochrome c reductase iron-sulfur subunit, partial [Candidatus Dormibacteraceae bacterium]